MPSAAIQPSLFNQLWFMCGEIRSCATNNDDLMEIRYIRMVKTRNAEKRNNRKITKLANITLPHFQNWNNCLFVVHLRLSLFLSRVISFIACYCLIVALTLIHSHLLNVDRSFSNTNNEMKKKMFQNGMEWHLILARFIRLDSDD